MFTRISNASNVALVKLVEYLNALSFDMIDCQSPPTIGTVLEQTDPQNTVFNSA